MSSTPEQTTETNKIQTALGKAFSSEQEKIEKLPIFSTFAPLAAKIGGDNSDEAAKIGGDDSDGAASFEKNALLLDLRVLLSTTINFDDLLGGATTAHQIKRSKYFNMDFLKKHYAADAAMVVADAKDDAAHHGEIEISVARAEDEATLISERRRYFVFYYILDAYLQNLKPLKTSEEKGDDNLKKIIINEFVQYLYKNTKFIGFVDGIAKRQEDMTDPKARATFSAECLNQILTCVDEYEENSDHFKKIKKNNNLESEATWRYIGRMLKNAALPLVLTIVSALIVSGVLTVPALLAAALWVKILIPTLLGLMTLQVAGKAYQLEEQYQNNASFLEQSAEAPNTGIAYILKLNPADLAFYQNLQASRKKVKEGAPTLQLYRTMLKTKPQDAVERERKTALALK